MIDKLFDKDALKTEILIDVQHDGLSSKSYVVNVKHTVKNGYREYVLALFLSSAIGDNNAKIMAEFFREKIILEMNL